MGVVSVSLPESLVEETDRLIARRGFAGRSEVVRAALREFLAAASQETERKGRRAATLTLVYPEGHERHIGEIRHAFNDIVKSMVHSHTGEDCIEVFVLQGDADRIRAFSERLRNYRESRLVQTVYADASPAGDEPARRPGRRG
ncbi:MAG TPA: CopG family ribbon-helix-helix protein [Candidatus Thermoplasmatota archaeon]|nr:CopG family ribbon-helix-helix protein [Candidatus Thermoplasmatota archaeon]